jgi:hypothetical protein
MNELRNETIETWNQNKADSLYSLLGKGLRLDRKKYTLRIFCKYAYEQKNILKSWMQQRVYFEGNDAHYCAGQDYPREITQIRKEITG